MLMNPNCNFIICVYATDNTPYIQIAQQQVLNSLEKLKIPHEFSKVQNFGSWKLNTAYKATFAMNMLNKHTDKNIVLLDADCRVFEYPSLFDFIPQQYNIAAHILDWATWYKNGTTTREFLTGTLILRNNNRTRQLVAKWIEGCEANVNTWEQKVLTQVIIENKEKIYELPLDYCYINSMPDGRQPNVIVEKPVIVHYQASRELKRILK